MSLDEELAAAVEAAQEAGEAVFRMRTDGLRYGRKYGRDLVSEADLRAAEILRDRLTTAFPDTGWLSEEDVDTTDRLRHERVWIVDPIDGTREYLMGLPEYAVSVGLVANGKAVLGVVHNPATGELIAGQTESAVEAQEGESREPFTVLVGRGESNHHHGLPLPPGGTRTGLGSIAYRLALISQGKGDAVVTNYGRNEWDVAAGIALCLGAGLRVTDVLGEPIRFNQPEPWVRGVLVAKPALHQRLHSYFGLLG